MTELRPVLSTDLDLICRHREAMFAEAGRDAQDIAAMGPSFRDWLEPRLRDGRYFGFIADQDGRSVGGIGLMLIEWPPHPSHPNHDSRGYVLNVFVDREQRGQGIARMLMDAADREFRRRGIPYVVLHATKAGRPLYERTGWAQTSEMAKTIRPVAE
ncbi:GNAT family acetyltransferase [Rhizobium sp. AC27/96]|uniref:GNAT family N-acetyltransferase n=1 Tax=Rhizobium sp. AC27/96 TaxID=1841653 RepID=UPI000827F6C8|nr:GNAT family N-acetyltransferase [Rhizobium sp. AC27/96]OCJ07444.1 GNAT family acetyltransferase [Rhizobium sp. AC27/96]